jgi:hypothetical protein
VAAAVIIPLPVLLILTVAAMVAVVIQTQTRSQFLQDNNLASLLVSAEQVVRLRKLVQLVELHRLVQW